MTELAVGDKRRRILDAAVVVFAEYGFYSSKVSQIAREASVADGTIYLYFKNKEDILIQVFIDAMTEIIARQELTLASASDPAARLRLFIRTHFAAVTESRALAEVLTVELRQSAKFMRDTDMKPFGQYLALIARIIDEGATSGAFARNLDSRLAARALFGALDELSLEWAMSHHIASADASPTTRDTAKRLLIEAGDRVATFFLQGLSARPSQPSAAPVDVHRR